jgi:hypothetical protein
MPVFSQDILAAFASTERLTGLSCSVVISKPTLGLDLKFHSLYQISVPIQELEGNGNTLVVLLKITARAQADQPVYLQQHFPVPAFDEHASGQAAIAGGFDTGAGSYHLDLLIHDRQGRLCSMAQDVNAALPPRTRTRNWRFGKARSSPSNRTCSWRSPRRTQANRED